MNVSVEWRDAVRKWTAWPSAWTPASVRPLAVVTGRIPVNRSRASSRTCCTVLGPGWRCHP